MDQLQLDATNAYELSKVQRKRRDSVVDEDTQSSTSELSPLVEEKAAKEISAVEDNGNWRSPLRSTKIWAFKINQWTQSGVARLIDTTKSAITSTTSNDGSGEYHDTLEMQQESGRIEHLMLCIPFNRTLKRLVQIELSASPASDATFFRLLKQEYFKNRQRYYGVKPFWRKVRRIHFVKFETIDPIQSPFRQLINIGQNDCLPPPTQVGWTRTAVLEYLPKPEQMAEFMYRPDLTGKGRETLLFSHVPRKLGTRIPDTCAQTGWGLYYVEGTRWALVHSILFFLWLSVVSLAVSLSIRA